MADFSWFLIVQIALLLFGLGLSWSLEKNNGWFSKELTIEDLPHKVHNDLPIIILFFIINLWWETEWQIDGMLLYVAFRFIREAWERKQRMMSAVLIVATLILAFLITVY